MDLRDTLWQLFNKTGNISYYLLWHDLEDKKKNNKRE